MGSHFLRSPAICQRREEGGPVVVEMGAAVVEPSWRPSDRYEVLDVENSRLDWPWPWPSLKKKMGPNTSVKSRTCMLVNKKTNPSTCLAPAAHHKVPSCFVLDSDLLYLSLLTLASLDASFLCMFSHLNPFFNQKAALLPFVSNK
jgi:hypothetical protein